MSKKRQDSAALPIADLARPLPERLQSITVFRIAVASVVLAIATVPTVTLLCTTWCAPEAVTHPCHDVASARVVNRHHDCDEGILATASFVREDVRRELFPFGGEHAVLLARHQLARLPIADHLGQAPGCDRFLARRPLETSLRI